MATGNPVCACVPVVGSIVHVTTDNTGQQWGEIECENCGRTAWVRTGRPDVYQSLMQQAEQIEHERSLSFIGRRMINEREAGHDQSLPNRARE